MLALRKLSTNDASRSVGLPSRGSRTEKRRGYCSSVIFQCSVFLLIIATIVGGVLIPLLDPLDVLPIKCSSKYMIKCLLHAVLYIRSSSSGSPEATSVVR